LIKNEKHSILKKIMNGIRKVLKTHSEGNKRSFKKGIGMFNKRETGEPRRI
jgi:hypothetical protein